MTHLERIGRDKSPSSFLGEAHQFLVDSVYLPVMEAIPIWGIGDHDPLRELFLYKIPNPEADIFEDAGSFRIGPCDLDHRGVDIHRGHSVGSARVYLGASCLDYLCETRSIKKRELLHSEASRESRCYIASDHDCFDRDRTRPAEWIYEGSLVFPVCKCDES